MAENTNRGISLTAVGIVGAGLGLVYFGIQNIPTLAGLRGLLKGELPQPVANKPTRVVFQGVGSVVQQGLSGASFGEQVANDALKYVGVPYVWGGADPSGWDCSGFATYVLHHDMGLSLPDNKHTVVSGFLTWKSAHQVPRSMTMPGDLVIYPATHMGIAIDADRMVHAPTPGEKTKVSNIYGIPLIYRIGVST